MAKDYHPATFVYLFFVSRYSAHKRITKTCVIDYRGINEADG
ncbi:MAG TPA: hypothetical protein VKA95_16330 [Nitrososphaeraceae archaeon]|nr:hypothetical protein [Nitrososphaeraceae archaeon]